MAWSDPKTWTADVMLTASDLNQYVSDNLSALYALVQGGGRKNLLHNGAMQVAQRGTSLTGITGGGYHTVDRWVYAQGGIGNLTASVEDDAPTGSGFRKSSKTLVASASDTTIDASDYLIFEQKIEGQNLQSVKKGTANAEPLTLSFWVKSNRTGVYAVELRDVTNTRHVCATYTVASSGTWERQSITFPADLTGAFANDNTTALEVAFWLAAGSDFTSGTLQTTWASSTAGSANRAVGQTNLASDVNNYFQITGVQLETGSAATGFQHKDYGTELSECQRYYYRINANGVNTVFSGYAPANSATLGRAPIALPVPMRVSPTDAGQFDTFLDDGVLNSYDVTGFGSPSVLWPQGANTALAWLNLTVASGLTAYRSYALLSKYSTGYVYLSADL